MLGQAARHDSPPRHGWQCRRRPPGRVGLPGWVAVDVEDINRAVRATRGVRRRPVGQQADDVRARTPFWKLGDLIYPHLDELAQLESLDNGKPYAVARAADVPLSADMFHYMTG